MARAIAPPGRVSLNGVISDLFTPCRHASNANANTLFFNRPEGIPNITFLSMATLQHVQEFWYFGRKNFE
jgi:hypothetical protein